MDCSPKTKRIDSATFDLPEPFGPTIEVIGALKSSVVFLANDLKPESSSRFSIISVNYIALGLIYEVTFKPYSAFKKERTLEAKMEKPNQKNGCYYFVSVIHYNGTGEEVVSEHSCYVGPFDSEGAVFLRFPHLKKENKPITISQMTEHGPKKITEIIDGLMMGVAEDSFFIFPPDCDYKEVMKVLEMAMNGHTVQ